jgi:hypothetical protein
MLQSLFYLTTALHVSGVTITHLQEHKTTVTTASRNRKGYQMLQMLQSLFYLTTALHVSGVTITHLQEHKRTVIKTSSNCYTVLLSAALVEDLELI